MLILSQIFCNQILKLNFVTADEIKDEIQRTKQRNSNLQTASLKDYDLIKVLGTGGFSQVLMGNYLIKSEDILFSKKKN